jgi:hypothetical protein
MVNAVSTDCSLQKVVEQQNHDALGEEAPTNYKQSRNHGFMHRSDVTKGKVYNKLSCA